MRDWDFVKSICDSTGADFDDIKATALAIEPRKRLAELGLGYQDYAYALARAIDAKVAVEAGVRSGVSTRYLLEALKVNAGAAPASVCLHSCDPMYKKTVHAREQVSVGAGQVADVPWEFYPARSIEALPGIAGPWDLFCHDSNPELENRTYEMEFAWQRLRKGGLLIVAQCDWPPQGPRQDAIQHFTERHGVQHATVGNAAVFVKDEDPGVGTMLIDGREATQYESVKIALDEVKRYGRGLTSAYDFYLKN